MRHRVIVIILIIFCDMIQSSAQNNDTVFWSVSPSLNTGFFGITDYSISPLEYGGPVSGVSIQATAEINRNRFLIGANCSYGWPGNSYHRDSKAMRDIYSAIELGYDNCFFSNDNISIRAGGAVDAMMNGYINLLFDRNNVSYAFDIRAYLSAEVLLSNGWALFIEERIPVISYMSAVKNYMNYMPSSRPEFSLVPFPGNDLNLGARHTFSGGNIVECSIHHKFHTSKAALSQRLNIRSLELCVGYCFQIKRRR